MGSKKMSRNNHSLSSNFLPCCALLILQAGVKTAILHLFIKMTAGISCRLNKQPIHMSNNLHLLFHFYYFSTFKGKEGAFMVRDSSHVGVYTVSVFTKAPG